MLRIHTLSVASASILGLAFVIMLFVSLSLPIIKDIYILDLQATPFQGLPATNTATRLRFGVWGVCAYGSFDEPTITDNTGDCFGPMLGYTIPENILALTGYPSIVNGLSTGLTVLLVLHPIAAVFSFLTAVFALLSIRRHTHNWAIASLVLSILTALLTTAVFAIDLVIIGVAQAEVPGLTNNEFNPSFGPVTWMMLVSAFLTYIGMVVESVKVCGCCGVGRMHHHTRGVEDAREHRYTTRRMTVEYSEAPADEYSSEAAINTPVENTETFQTAREKQPEQDWWWYWPPSWWSSGSATRSS